MDRARDILGPALADQVRGALAEADPFAGLTVARIDAALRLLPAQQSAALWDQIDRKIGERGNWRAPKRGRKARMGYPEI